MVLDLSFRVLYAFVMSIECEDKIDVLDYELSEMSAEFLKSLVTTMSGCKDCDACAGEVKLLELLIAEKG